MNPPRFTRVPQRQLPDKVADEARRDQVRAIEEIQDHVRQFPSASRTMIRRQTFQSSGIWTPNTATRAVLLRMVGGGGGGGGTTGGANFAFGGGGWSGVYWEKWIESDRQMSGGAVTIGAAGAAGAANAQGGTGGDTSCVVNGKTYTASGGAGGLGMPNGAGPQVTGIPASTNSSTSGADFNVQERGEQGIQIAAGAGWSGCGGNNPLGSGGVTTATGNGGAANIGYGGGGGGAISAAADKTGGAGGAGCVLIEEFS